jgi:sporulation integral membrane protein YtvI
MAISVVIILLIIFVLPKIVVFFTPFLVGWVLALIAAPFVLFLEKRLKIKRKAGSAVIIILVIGLIVLLLYLIGAKLVEEGIQFFEDLPALWQDIQKELAQIGANLTVVYDRFPPNIQEAIRNLSSELAQSVSEGLGSIGSPALVAVGDFARKLPAAIIAVIMALLFSYFFVADRTNVYAKLKKHTPKSLQHTFHVVKKSLGKGVGGYFKAQLKIEIGMYILLVIGLSILRVEYTLLIALGIAILDFIPFFGTGTVMVPWAIIAILGSDYRMAIGLAIIWGVGQLARQIIQPKMVGDSIGVPPIPTLILLYVGFKVGGVLGMIFAVPIGLVIYTMYQEGIFDTTITSVRVLLAGINRFRKFKEVDLEVLKEEIEGEEESAGD